MTVQNNRLYQTPCHKYSDEVTIDCYIHEPNIEITKRKRPVMVVFPGGGYEFTSRREAESIAISYYSKGYNAYVCNYTVGSGRCERNNPLLDAAAAVKYVRDHAAEHNNDTDRVAVIGFSAGGHLAGFIATSYTEQWLADALGTDSDTIKVNAAILCYPVVSGGEYAHRGSFDALLGKDADEKAIFDASLENRVTKSCPPMFIWTTMSDDAVSAQNSLLMAKALADKKIPYELHVFPHGKHGLSLADWQSAPDWDAERAYILPDVAKWFEMSVDWLDNTVFGISRQKL